MSEKQDNLLQPEPPAAFTEAQIDHMEAVIDELLPSVCAGTNAAGTPERYVLVTAYMLTAAFHHHPHLYDAFMNLLETFAPRYEALIQQFSAAHPQMWADRASDEIFVLTPSVAEQLQQSVN